MPGLHRKALSELSQIWKAESLIIILVLKIFQHHPKKSTKWHWLGAPKSS